MKPRPSIFTGPVPSIPATKTKLSDLVHPSHPLVSLTAEKNWPTFDLQFGCYYSDDQGRPALPTRLLVGLHYLKYAHDLSDEATVQEFLENPYWQYFCGNEYFEHALPCHPTTLSRWRNRIGIKGSEAMLKETIELGRRKKIIPDAELSRVAVDTTVQEKAITYPTDAKLYHKARQRLVVECRKLAIKLRQTYVRSGPKVLLQHARYRHQKKSKLAKRALKKLKTFLGRVIRDIRRQLPDPPPAMRLLLAQAVSILNRHPKQKDKIYSLHAPEVSCIAKGKAKKKYEFGSKVSIATTAKSCWVLAVQSFQGNPYDGHTLSDTLWMIKNLHNFWPEEVYLDQGYKGFDSLIWGSKAYIAGKAKNPPPNIKRRSSIEPVIGHMKHDHRLGRNHLLGAKGDGINAVMSGAGFNLRKLMAIVYVGIKRIFERFCFLLGLNHSLNSAPSMA
ncbi:MAG: IS5 family transposase [Pseudobdellovibrionaceae bacterium]|nr:IS5 family transposase [Pseudobdellovibrionaceae bacterium]